MKKLIAIIAIIALVSAVAFAGTDPVASSTNETSGAASITGTSDIYLKTTVSPKASAGWLATRMTALPTAGSGNDTYNVYKEINATNNDLVSETNNGILVFTESVLNHTVYPTVISNLDSVVTVKISATPLAYVKGSGENAVTYTIPYSISTTVKGAASATSTAVTNATVSNFATFATTASGLEYNDASMTFSTTVAALNSATSGTYQATVTLSVSSN